MTSIVTHLDRDAVIAALRELAPKDHNPRLFQSTSEGEISPDRVTIGYRFGWFASPIRLVTFAGQVRENGENIEIKGSTSSGWIIYVFAAWLIVAAPLALIQYALAGDYAGVLWSIVTAVVLFFLGRAFVRSTQDYVAN